jgi:hypothetical protein
MTTNKYFNHLYDNVEQSLMADILQEAIQVYGIDAYYIVRDIEDFDTLLREEKLSVFRTTYKIDAYLTTPYESNMTKYMTKFGFRFEDNCEIVISAQSWDEIGTGFPQPREGDYIYIGDPEDQHGSFVNSTYLISNVWDNALDTPQYGIISFRLVLTSATRNFSNVLDTNYSDINEFLNPTLEKENKTTIKKPADDFADINVVPAGNAMTKWGVK